MGILGRARKMVGGLAGTPPRVPQLYQVACVAGHRLRGERTEGYQALRCPSCGEGIFVLPRSPLPEPPSPASPARPRIEIAEPDLLHDDDDLIALTDPLPGAANPAPPGDVEIDWEEEVAQPAPPPNRSAPSAEAPKKEARPKGSGDRTQPKPASDGRARRPGRPSGPRPPAPAPPVPRPTLAEWARRHRTPLLTAGVLVLVLGALVVRHGRQRLETLPLLAERGRTEGLQDLDAGKFHAAKQILAEAVLAVDGLGGRVEGADEIRQGAREAAIFTDLVPETLERIVEEAATFRDVSAWSEHFGTMYRGRSIILDAPLSEVPDPDRPGSRYRIDYKLFLGKGPKPDGKARIDLADFELFETARSTIGEQKPFGARLASLELDLGANEWVIGLEPDSGVFITHARALEAIGWPGPEAPSEPQP